MPAPHSGKIPPKICGKNKTQHQPSQQFHHPHTFLSPITSPLKSESHCGIDTRRFDMFLISQNKGISECLSNYIVGFRVPFEAR